MNTNCEIIRDLLPLYADEVCSSASSQLVRDHLAECPECTEMLEKLRSHTIETDLQTEKDQIIEHQAKKFRRRSATVGSVISGVFMIPVLICLIVNITSGAALDWFFIVLGGLAVAASLIIVPLMVPENKLFWTFCAFCVSLMLLLAICSIYSGGLWFFPAASASLFGLSVVFLPFVLRAEPVRKLIGNFDRRIIVIAVDLILFGNMMNMVTLTTKNVFVTILMLALCSAAAVLLWSAIQEKRGETK